MLGFSLAAILAAATCQETAETALAPARLKLAEAEREADAARRVAALEAAAVLYRDVIRRHGAREEALSDLSVCLKEKGRLLALQGASGPAAAAFAEAEALFKGAGLTERYERGLVLLARGQALGTADDLRKVIALYTEELVWLADGTVLLYELYLQAGRAWETLAVASGTPHDWDRCFSSFVKGRGALTYELVEAQEVGARATLLEMRARLRHGTPKSLAAAVACGDSYLKLKRRPGGPILLLIRLELGKALGLAGRTSQAVALLKEVRADAKGTTIESAALDLLAEFAGATDPKIALDAADDLLERGEITRALVKFRGCAAVLRGKPEAVRGHLGAGTCYFRLGRWREAAVAFTVLEELKADTVDTGTMKLGALNRLKDLTNDPADTKAYQDHLAAMAKKGGDAVKEMLALELEQQGRWKEASAAWLEIGSDRALYRAGRARFLEPDAVAALDLFQRHLAKAPQSPEAFRSTVYAARCLVLLKRPAEALAIAEGAETKWPAAEPRMLQWLILQRAQARAQQGLAAEAEADVDAIRRIWKKESSGIDYLSRGLAVAAEAWEQAAKDDAAWARAVRCWYEYFQLNPPDPKKDADRLELIADKLVEIAPRVKEAKDLWSMARDLYAQRRLTGRGGVDAIRRREARCFIGMERYEDAVDALRELAAADPSMVNGGLWEELADAWAAWARSFKPGSDRSEKFRKAIEIYGKLSSALRRVEGPHYWRVTFSYAQSLWETDLEKLRDFFSDMSKRGYAAKWDDGEFKSKFESLKAQLEKKLPGGKP